MSWWNDPLNCKFPEALVSSSPTPTFTPSARPTSCLRAPPSTSKTKKSPLIPDHVMVDPFFEYQFRLILIGDSTVGKSSLLRNFTEGTFAELSDPTVGVDFFARLVELRDGTNIKLQLWDTAGQERFRSITKSYYRNSVGAILTYDICNRESYAHIPTWMSEAKRHIEPHKAVFILVGCKYDMADSDDYDAREVSYEEAKAFADFHSIHFVETSAKTSYQVQDAFILLAQEINEKIKSGEFKLEEGWDGIKRGYTGSSTLASSYSSSIRRLTGSNSGRSTQATDQLAMGQPAQSTCC